MWETNKKYFVFSFFIGCVLLLTAQTAHAAPTAEVTSSLVGFTGTSSTNDASQSRKPLIMDFNCDGDDDVVLSAPGYSSAKGRIYVQFGGATFSSVTLASGNFDVTVTGSAVGDGISADGTADVDGDGCEDLIGLSSDTSSHNILNVYLGSASWSGSYTYGPSIYAYSVTTSSTGQGYSWLHHLGPLDGDVNGDGSTNDLDDYLGLCSDYTGECYLLTVETLTSGSSIENAATYEIYGYASGIYNALASGDINNDGYDDLVVGEATDDYVSIIWGPLASSASLQTQAGPPTSYFDTTPTGLSGEDIAISDAVTAGANFASAVHVAHVYGTDYADVIIGAYAETVDSYTGAGRYHVISGESLTAFKDAAVYTGGVDVYNDETTGTYNYSDITVTYFAGNGSTSMLGENSSNLTTGDFNGDGITDMALGSQYYSNGDNYGVLYVVHTGDLDTMDGVENILGASEDTSEFYFQGDDVSDELSYLTSSGDVTGDGIDDLLFSVPGDASGYGAVYIWEGRVGDYDGDGYNSAIDSGGGVYVAYDCNDKNDDVSPGDTEVASNGIDDDCDGSVDEALDSDGDGYDADSDCDDASASVYPGATESCNSVDDDCDGSTDEGVTVTYYADADGDTYGDASSTTAACSAPAGYVTNDDDCDDSSAGISPADSETCGDGIDQDCSGADTVCSGLPTTDDDSDGYTEVAGDCDDGDAAISPSATEACDSVDNDCDGTVDDGVSTTYYADADGDTYGDASSTTSACALPAGYVTNDDDCDDTDADTSPADTEVCGDGIDQDCSGADTTCSGLPSTDDDSDGYTENAGDCDDGDAAISPSATEVCDSVDNDCDGTADDGVSVTYYADADGDTYGDASSTTSDCSPPAGYVSNDDDCDDSNSLSYPSATELADGEDNDCDGRYDEGFVRTEITTIPSSASAGDTIDITYTITNNSGLEDFNAEILINNSVVRTTKLAYLAPGNPALGVRASKCSSASCTTLDDSDVYVSSGTIDSITVTVTLPASITTGNHSVRVRIYENIYDSYMTQDLDAIEIL